MWGVPREAYRQGLNSGLANAIGVDGQTLSPRTRFEKRNGLDRI